MPIVQIEMFKGRTIEQKKNLVDKVTQAIVDSVGTTADHVTIIIREMDKENYAIAGKLESEKSM